MSNFSKSESSILTKPKFEDFSLTLKEYNLLNEELEIYILEIKSINDKFENTTYNIFEFIIKSFSVIFGVVFLIGVPLSILSFYVDLTKFKDIVIYLFYLFGLYCAIIVIAVFIQLLGLEYFNFIESRLKKRSKYVNFYKYKKANAEYQYSIRLCEKNYWMFLSGRSFEIEVANLFRSKGFIVNLTKQGGDGGIDLVIKNRDSSFIIGVQCKAHRSKIPPYIARDLLGTIISFKYNKGYLITLEGGTQGTIDFCKKNNIVIWDVNDIVNFRLNDNLTVDTFYENLDS